jgi:hypothetical protein
MFDKLKDAVRIITTPVASDTCPDCEFESSVHASHEHGEGDLMGDAIVTMAAYMGNTHAKYREAFGAEPHGTVKQYAALIELCPQLREAIRLWYEQRQRMETE